MTKRMKKVLRMVMKKEKTMMKIMYSLRQLRDPRKQRLKMRMRMTPIQTTNLQEET